MTNTQAHAVPDEGEEALAPGDHSDTDPTPPLPAEQGDGLEPDPAKQPVGSREEPEIANEQDIPSDGADVLGENMIKNLKPFAQRSARAAC
jgi:hypothetical protein